MANVPLKDTVIPVSDHGDHAHGLRVRTYADHTEVDGLAYRRADCADMCGPTEELLSMRQRADGGLDVQPVEEVPVGGRGGPAQVASPEYRDGWDRIFKQPQARA